jgi:hypothetical protein
MASVKPDGRARQAAGARLHALLANGIALAALAGPIAPGCARATALPSVARVAPELAALRVHVHRDAKAPPAPSYQEGLDAISDRVARAAFEMTLARAGFVVVLRPHEPRDVTALVTARFDLHDGSLTTTLTLEAGGQTVGELSRVLGPPYLNDHPRYPEELAATLVEAMSRLPAVASLAREAAGKGTLQVAAPAETQGAR